MAESERRCHFSYLMLGDKKEAAIAVAAAKKAEEDKQAILDAVAASGKSIEEILELLGK